MPKKEVGVKIRVNTEIYPVDAIIGASYVFIDRAYVYLEKKGPKEVLVDFRAKEGVVASVAEKIKGEFLNELLNYAHRINISKNNKKIRERIVERALYSAIEDDSSLFGMDELDDPLGIAVPWEEKYGEKKS